MTKTWIKAGEQRPMRRFAFYLGNPLVRVAFFEAYSEDEAWDYAEEIYGHTVYCLKGEWNNARMNEVIEEGDAQ